MYNIGYFPLRKQNILTRLNLYIFILFLSNLNSFSCEEKYDITKDNLEKGIIDPNVYTPLPEGNYHPNSQEIEQNGQIVSYKVKCNVEDADNKKDNYTDLILSLKNQYYFNNIIKFDKKNYQSGKFATNRNGDLILELYENVENVSSRLFYGLTKEGRYFFSKQSSFTQEINIEDFSYKNRNLSNNYNSANLFISIGNISYEFLFSINSNISKVELYDLFNDNNGFIT